MDWGLGHASRCIRIIQELQQRNCEVIIASSGDALNLLRAEFPDVHYFSLPGYSPKYSRSNRMVLKMFLQFPHFLSVIRKEHHAVEDIIQEQNSQVVISDNRYGCWSKKAISVLITHQSNIMMPKRFGWLKGFVRKMNVRQMRKFQRIWIPDTPGKGLSGDLKSFGKVNEVAFEFIGNISRFRIGDAKESLLEYDVVAILSGPEPQRSIFEKIVLRQLKESSLKWFLVRGVFDDDNTPVTDKVVNHLTSKKLLQLINRSGVVLARCGYSTVMDLAALQKRAILIPTPGQTEQEYLAHELSKMGIIFTTSQEKLNIEVAMREVMNTTGLSIPVDDSLLTNALDKLLQESL
jgi:uncharacterized protein (TIGR00661 family)